jgi:glycosyltransferase involved in cell wall biosynthesis
MYEDGLNGFLSEVGDVDKMADDALKLLQNANLQQNFSESAKNRAANHFSAKIIVSQYEKYYQDMVKTCKEKAEGN